MEKGRKVDSTEVALPFRQKIKEQVSAFIASQANNSPLIVGFLSNSDPAAVKYAEWTRKSCEEDGIRFELRTVDHFDLEDALSEANEDPSVHGIMIYYPIFGGKPSFYGGSMDDYLRDSIRPEKDVEGLCHMYRYNLYHNVRYVDHEQTFKCILPCTPLAVVKILEYLKVYNHELHTGNRLSGKTVVVINRSEIVGRPLAAMLANDGADVYSVDIQSLFLMRKGRMLETSETTESACRKADVIITGVPTKDYRLQTEWVKPNTVVVNVSSFKNVDEEALLQIPGVVYVPNVGKVTVSMLERNLVRLYENFHLNGTRRKILPPTFVNE